MKKINLLLLGLFCLILTGCGNNETREVGSLGDFENISVNNGFAVSDNMNSYSGVDYITGAMKATTDDVTIEMVIYDTEENTDKVQENQIKNFMNIRSVSATAEKEKGANFYKFTMISNGYYMVSSKIDNTLIFSKTLLENKEKVETILDSMGY